LSGPYAPNVFIDGAFEVALSAVQGLWRGKMRVNGILYSRYPGKIFKIKSFCTGGVNIKREMDENFFKLWKAQGLVLISGGYAGTTLCISKGEILEKKNFFERDIQVYIRPPDSRG
jgi:hypothetical protein